MEDQACTGLYKLPRTERVAMPVRILETQSRWSSGSLGHPACAEGNTVRSDDQEQCGVHAPNQVEEEDNENSQTRPAETKEFALKEESRGRHEAPPTDGKSLRRGGRA